MVFCFVMDWINLSLSGTLLFRLSLLAVYLCLLSNRIQAFSGTDKQPSVINHPFFCSEASERLLHTHRLFEVWALSLHTSTTRVKFNGHVVNSGANFFTLHKAKWKPICQPVIQHIAIVFFLFIMKSLSVSLCPCVQEERVSGLISKFLQWTWTPCWHIHSTWATADSFEYNLHNCTSSSSVKPPTPCCSQENHMRKCRHIYASGKQTLNAPFLHLPCVRHDGLPASQIWPPTTTTHMLQ